MKSLPIVEPAWALPTAAARSRFLISFRSTAVADHARVDQHDLVGDLRSVFATAVFAAAEQRLHLEPLPR